MHNLKRWSVVVVFAAAMAWVESAVVFYLRTMVDRIEPHQPMPLPIATGLGRAELVREAATLIMLLAVGVLAGRTWRSRFGYAAVAQDLQEDIIKNVPDTEGDGSVAKPAALPAP